jgi:hypothetical protein
MEHQPGIASRRRRWLVALALSALVLCLLAGPAAATVVRFMSLEKLVERSDTIVRARLVDSRTYFDSDQNVIVTDSTFRVDRDYLSSVGDEIVVQQWGGELGDRALVIPGDAHFKKGEETILFLKKGDGTHHYLTALAQSKYRVWKKGKFTYVQRDLSELSFLAQGAKTPGKLVEAKESFRSFEAQLLTHIQAIKKIEPAPSDESPDDGEDQ